MKVERMARSGQISRQARMRSSVLSWLPGRRIAFSTVGRGVLERDVEIGQDLALRHQRDDLVDMRVGIDVVQAHPGAELAELLRGRGTARAPRGPASGSSRIHVDAIGRGVLRDDEQLLDARLHELLGLAQHVADGPRDKVAAQLAG